MKKLILSCLFFFSFQCMFCQTNQSISIEFKGLTQKQALLKLESIIDFTFYFQDDWFDDSKIVSGTYSDTSLETVLNDIFKNTTINYFIFEDKIVLTNNSVVYDTLPENYFNEDTLSVFKPDKKPIFYNDYTIKDANKNSSTLIIGKQNKNSSQTTFRLLGVIKDENSNTPIENMVISIRGSNSNTTTNNKGFFTLEVPAGLVILETKLFGYEDIQKEVLVYGNGSINLSASESAQQLEEVNIEANANQNVKDVVVGLTKINTEGIKNIPVVLGERNILKVATTLPGIKTVGEGASGYNVRGGRADQNLILLDDAVLYTPSHFLGFFSALNPFTTGSADIYKGSIPVEFGGRISSVFDIKTKDGNQEKLTGEGSIGPITANLSIETPVVKNKSSLVLGVRSTYSQWILKSLDEESLKNSQASFYDGVLKYNHKINEKNNIQSTLYYSNDVFSITSDSIFSYNNLLASVKWNHSFNAKNKAELIAVNSQYKYGIEFEGNANSNFDFDYTINEAQIKLKMRYLHSKKHKFDYGISSKLYRIDPGNISPLGSNSIVETRSINQEKGLESAIYISDLFEVNDKLLLDFGLRYSVFSALGERTQNIYETNGPKNASTVIETRDFGNNETIKTYGGPELRLSLRYFLSPDISVKASYNKTIQYLHLLSSNTTISPTDIWKLSDLNIEPQRADQLALGLYKNFKDNSFEVSIEGYYKRMSSLLDYKVGAELLLNENIEQEVLQGEGKAYGAEVLIKKDKGKLNGWLGYTYSRAFVKLDSAILQERVNNGEFFPANFDKPHDFSLIANYKLTQRYSISTNFTYQTGRPITYPVGKFIYAGEEQVLYSDRNQFRIPDYYRLDLGINIEGNHKIKKLAHSFWNISVYNVLGRNNPYSVFFVSENGEVQAYKTSIFSIPVPTITYNFKF
ncbi:carboxypeptidase-like regulatory domain-containing protein [Hyunsoonleella sp. SJ7]|uniref:Carboxypeptidase-like regulatory domain-containing protein n=1 Tax=Hyunsoonleella aquatilis TaxID=2762758 RepID=A0A923KJN7_9FLAO|nr:carboxypeptidase-like regulatory domain-containing protein [Hyunsoonleella aquatilis]MBC3756863.1 carboxypeptidase-like regulatory domain-containing protein [Hyunsoonleella aquatilis]